MASERLDIIVTDNGTTRKVTRDIKELEAASASAGYSVRSLDHVLGALGAGFVVAKFAHFADEWQNIHNKLLNVTSSTQNLNAVNEALFQGAQKSRTEYGEFVNVYQELAIQAQRFGISQKQAVDVTTTMMQAAQLAHPSLAAMKAGVEQLVLTMERGRMTTRAFSALLKDTPQLAVAMADGLGISINQLRELAHHSALTSSQMIAALEKVGPKVAEQFLKLAPTFHNSMTVLHNGWVKFIGDLDGSTGILGHITDLIIGMSHHVDELAMAVVIFGAVASTVFGGLVKRAILGMWGALVAAGPIGWAIAAIGTLAGALAIYGNQVTITQDKQVTLLDYVKGAFDVMAVGWNHFGEVMVQTWQSMSPAVQAVLSGMWQGFVVAMQGIWEVAKFTINGIIGLFVFAFKAGVVIWNDLGAALKDIFVQVFNFLSEQFSKFLNSVIDGINLLAKATPMGAMSMVEIGHVGAAKFQGGGGAAKLDKDMGGALGSAFGTDYVGAAVDGFAGSFSAMHSAIMGEARKHSAARRAGGNGLVDTGHGAAEDDPMKGKKPHKGSHKKSRAEIMAEDMRELLDQTGTANNLDATFLTKDAYHHVDALNKKLREARYSQMSPEERAAELKAAQALADAKRLEAARDEITRAALGPRQTYIDQEKAIGQLVQHGTIDAAQATRALLDAKIAFLSTKEDATSGLMLGQLKIIKEMRDNATPLATAMVDMWKTANDPLRKYMDGMRALIELQRLHLINTEKATEAERAMQIAYLETEHDMGSGALRALLKVRDDAEDVASAVETAFSNAFKNLEDAFVNFAKTGKINFKSLLDGVIEDTARASFKSTIGGPLAEFMQSKFGISMPSLTGPLGSSVSNPMWVKDANGGLFGAIGGSRNGTNGVPTGNLNGLLDGLDSTKLGTGSPLDKVNTVPDKLDKTFQQFHIGMNSWTITMGAMLTSVLGSALGGKAGSIISSVAGGIATLAGALHGTGIIKGFATGTDFTVGGVGAVDSQLVQFKASPGEKVTVGRAGQGQSGGSGGDTYHIDVYAPGSEAGSEERIHAAVMAAMQVTEAKARQGAMKDLSDMAKRQRMVGAR